MLKSTSLKSRGQELPVVACENLAINAVGIGVPGHTGYRPVGFVGVSSALDTCHLFLALDSYAFDT